MDGAAVFSQEEDMLRPVTGFLLKEKFSNRLKKGGNGSVPAELSFNLLEVGDPLLERRVGGQQFHD
jgi:hypothetical protein